MNQSFESYGLFGVTPAVHQPTEELWVQTVEWTPCVHLGDRVAHFVIERLDPTTGEVITKVMVLPAALGPNVGALGPQGALVPPGLESAPTLLFVDGSIAWLALSPSTSSEAQLVGVSVADGNVVKMITIPNGLTGSAFVAGKAFGMYSPGQSPPQQLLTRVDLTSGAADVIFLSSVPHQIVAGDGVLYVRLPPADGSPFDTVASVDPQTGTVTELTNLNLPIVDIAAASGALWALTPGPTATVVRMDPRTGRALSKAALPGSDEDTYPQASIGSPTGLLAVARDAVPVGDGVNKWIAVRNWWVDNSGDVTEVPVNPQVIGAGIYDDQLVGLTDGHVVASPTP